MIDFTFIFKVCSVIQCVVLRKLSVNVLKNTITDGYILNSKRFQRLTDIAFRLLKIKEALKILQVVQQNINKFLLNDEKMSMPFFKKN